MELDSDFESKLKEQVLDKAEDRLRDPDGPVAEAIERSEDRLEAVAAQHDYEVENVIDSLDGPTVERTGDRIEVWWGWTHEAAAHFEWGTEDHMVEGTPVLAFEYPVSAGGPGGMVFSAGHEVEGIEEARYARAGINQLRHELRNEGL